MITFVCWKWHDARVGRMFTAHHVNVLAASVRRHYDAAHRFVCVTDEPDGLADGIEHVPMPQTGFEHLTNPSQKHAGKPFPSCYRRLWNFSREARDVLGERIFALDIDAIVCDSLKPLVRKRASFVGWCDRRFEAQKCAGGAYMLTTGAHADVWEDFDPHRSPIVAKAHGLGGSDQAWMSLKLYPPRESFGSMDGVGKLGWLQPQAALPRGVRLVFTKGASPPWDAAIQQRYPWITDHWHA